jgi:hypothetical protein
MTLRHSDTQYNNALPLCCVSRLIYCYAECHAECRGAVVYTPSSSLFNEMYMVQLLSLSLTDKYKKYVDQLIEIKCAIKLFRAVIYSIEGLANVFVTVCHFHPSLIFATMSAAYKYTDVFIFVCKCHWMEEDTLLDFSLLGFTNK